jgi:hypothetical protein
MDAGIVGAVQMALERSGDVERQIERSGRLEHLELLGHG